jgi:Zn-finger nucleic acid-binding protein
MSSNQVVVTQSEGTEVTCPGCGGSFTKKGYVDHLFRNRDCMRAYWREEERMHAYNVRHRSLNRKKEREMAQASGHFAGN